MTEAERFSYLIVLAKSVRAAQKKYFKTRSADDLKASKQAEKELDDFLRRLNEERNQPRLF